MMDMDLGEYAIQKMYLLGYKEQEIQSFFEPYLDSQPESQVIKKIISSLKNEYPGTFGTNPKIKWVNAAVVRLHPEFFFEPEEPASFGVETRGMFINDDNMLNKVCEFIEKMAKQHLYMKRCSVYLGLFFDGVEDDEVGGFLDLADVLASTKKEGIYHFFNCSCGCPSCGGGCMVIALHRADDVILLIEGSDSKEIIKINQQSYSDGIEYSIKNIYAVKRFLQTQYNIATELRMNLEPTFNAARRNYRKKQARD